MRKTFIGCVLSIVILGTLGVATVAEAAPRVMKGNPAEVQATTASQGENAENNTETVEMETKVTQENPEIQTVVPNQQETTPVENTPENTSEPQEQRELTEEEKMEVFSPVTATEPTEGTAGRLFLKDGWSVALYYSDPWDFNKTQEIVNEYDSAAYCYDRNDNTVLIADHSSQGFIRVKDYKVGDTFEIVKDGVTHKYQCISYYEDATWENGDAYLPDGRSIWKGDSPIITQTCNNAEGTSITIQYWREV